MNDSDRWKAEQRDWLVNKLTALVCKWMAESEKKGTFYCPDPEFDRFAKGRTRGCASELTELLDSLGAPTWRELRLQESLVAEMFANRSKQPA